MEHNIGFCPHNKKIRGMKIRISVFIIGIFMLGLFMTSICMAQNNSASHYYNTKGHFSFTLPDGWEEIPKNVIDEYAKLMQKLMQKQATEPITVKYEVGFQLEDSPEWVTYPYIVVQIDQEGKIPETELLKYMSSGEGKEAMEESVVEVEEAFPSLLNNVKLGKYTYDRARSVLFMKMQANIAQVGNIMQITATCLSGEGFVNIAFYSLEQDFQRYLPQFDKLIHLSLMKGMNSKEHHSLTLSLKVFLVCLA